ncbi:hypothetical protein PENSPDRAFT_657508 [Peniophora sp. CONT]|nr:hypothetical protein PENSPDRAFT_657508 [Peniophora sp. CONT]
MSSHLRAPADDIYGGGSGSSSSRYLSTNSPRRQPATLKSNRSSQSLRGASLSQTMDDDGGSRFSLAHELAAALMPEPSAGSKLLSEEFGIDYDEGAEGIDEDVQPETSLDPGASLAAELDPHAFGSEHSPHSHLANELDSNDTSQLDSEFEESLDPAFGEPAPSSSLQPKRTEQDAMAVLSSDLETTDKFLADLRRLDAESVSQPALERLALDWIRKIDESARDREGQVRELLEYEREFRKISADALAGLPAIEGVEGLADEGAVSTANAPTSTQQSSRRPLSGISEDADDWEVDPDRHMRDEEDAGDGFDDAQATPIKDTFSVPPPPSISGPVTPAKAIPQLAHLRSSTTSLVSSLVVISEHAQVNGAATADAGRKIRALKNKLGGWRTEWDSAERSRLKIERWEEDPGSKVNGRKVVEEHLRAFELAISEASMKTQAIMAAS